MNNWFSIHMNNFRFGHCLRNNKINYIQLIINIIAIIKYKNVLNLNYH